MRRGARLGGPGGTGAPVPMPVFYVQSRAVCGVRWLPCVVRAVQPPAACRMYVYVRIVFVWGICDVVYFIYLCLSSVVACRARCLLLLLLRAILASSGLLG